MVPRSKSVAELVQALDNLDRDARVPVIAMLGEIGDVAALKALQERLDQANREVQALIVAVAKLQARLGGT
jgi:HEAT repeat protein